MTVASLAVVVAVLAMLWRFPSAEVVAFHVVWIGLALLALRTGSPGLQSWALVGFVTVLATIIEVHDVTSGEEGFEFLVLIPIDVVAFVALVLLARRHRRALESEHAAALAEQGRNERQRAFFANASHALRTPITVARGHAEMSLRNSPSPIPNDDLLVVLDELDRLTRATDRIMQLSVAEEFDPRRRHVIEVAELVTSTVERWRPTAPRAWSAVIGCTGQLIADPEALTEALDALIENAVAATAVGGAITVRAEAEGDTLVLSVTDNGDGVDGVDTERLFDAFQQGPRRSGQASTGTGLGLAIVRAVAGAHGGEATIESAPGSGTTAKIALPFYARWTPRTGSSGQSPVLA